jgi:TPR repeat protein
MYEEGLGVDRDESQAVHWYRLSGEQGYPWAMCNLGFCQQNGIGCDKDEIAGAYWYQRAAIQGHSRAQHNLGHAYQYGRSLALVS